MKVPEIFSLTKLINHKLRAQRLNLPLANFLFEEAANIIQERLESIEKDFANVLDYNNGETFILSDYLSKRDGTDSYNLASLDFGINPQANLIINPEALQLPEKSFDLFVALLNLHWINDLPGFLIQVKRALKENGLFIGTCFGRQTLRELRKAIYLTQEKLNLPYTNHISPFIDSEDGASLLQRAGFSFIVSDFDEIVVTYPNVASSLHDLRGMGETNNMKLECNPFNRRFLSYLERTYQEHFSNEGTELNSTFEIITLAGANLI